MFSNQEFLLTFGRHLYYNSSAYRSIIIKGGKEEMYKKALSLLLALMLIVTSLSVAVISVAASGSDASGLTVTADSNFFPTETQSFTQDQIDSNGGMVTVTYSIQSEENLLNTDWLLTYDGTVLQFDEVTNKPVPASISFVPSVAGLIIAGEVIKDIIHGF